MDDGQKRKHTSVQFTTLVTVLELDDPRSHEDIAALVSPPLRQCTLNLGGAGEGNGDFADGQAYIVALESDMTIVTYSPVDLAVTDPQGRVIPQYHLLSISS